MLSYMEALQKKTKKEMFWGKNVVQWFNQTDGDRKTPLRNN